MLLVFLGINKTLVAIVLGILCVGNQQDLGKLFVLVTIYERSMHHI
jgi:hypothetical protein